jgi:ABC-type branched-subunit amino acid transport system ATPase component
LGPPKAIRETKNSASDNRVSCALDETAAGLSPAECGRLLDTLRTLPPAVTLLMMEHGRHRAGFHR